MSKTGPSTGAGRGVTVFYDAACPVCALEIDALTARCGSAVRAVDIAAPGFDAGRHGFAAADLDAAMHLRRDDGTVVRGMDAVRALYGAAGLPRAVAWTAHPSVRGLFDRAYAAFARHRRAISGALRPAVAAVRRVRGMPPATGRGAGGGS
jgi:predicted DCC family thiol-disulfide oxidoreductase YuxK